MSITLKNIREKFEDNIPKPIDEHRYFSVLAPFVEKDDKLYMLFEVRAKNMDRQPGEVCFPGGEMEEGENPIDAAIRETCEEIGVSPFDIEIIGSGNSIEDHIGFTMYSVIGVIKEEALNRLKLSEAEVDKVFLVDFEKFIENPPEIHEEQVLTKVGDDFPYEKVGITPDYPWKAGVWRQPVYDVSEDVIWGLTARIVKNIVDSVKL